MLVLAAYRPQDRHTWDSLVKESPYATFQHQRDYIEYHKTRWIDASFFLKKGEELIAAIPGNSKENQLYSHQGLSFGGVLWRKGLSMEEKVTYIEDLPSLLSQAGFSSFHWKEVPSLFCDERHIPMPNALLKKVNKGYFIPNDLDLNSIRKKRRLLKKAEKAALAITWDDDLAKFWQEIVQPIFREKFGSKPVHSLQEILQLKAHFPQHIQLVTVYQEKTLLGGIVLFCQGQWWHTQYTCGSSEGLLMGAIDLLMWQILNSAQNQGKTVSLGTALDDQGHFKASLAEWKKSWGALEIPWASFYIDLLNSAKPADEAIS